MLVAPSARGRGQAGVDADQGAAVGFVGAVVGGVRRLVGQRLQFRRAGDHQGRDRQFGAQRVRFVEVEVEDGGGLARQRVRMVLPLTFGLPSRSPPIQLPICTYGA
jgi:hypothetical protein